MSEFSIQVRLAARSMKEGGVIAYPTEGVWGLGCDPLNEDAVERILDLKSRPRSKGLIVLATEMRQLTAFTSRLDSEQRLMLERSRGSSTTWLIPAGAQVPRWLRGDHETLAVRLTDHSIVNQLCQAFGGAILSTSANPAGLRPARSALDVKAYFGDLIDVIVPGSTGGQNGASEIRDMLTDRVVRPRGT